MNKNSNDAKKLELDQYLKNNFFDIHTLIESISNKFGNNYIYFGDLQTNTFYISDNLKEKFGFESNIVKDLLKVWGSRIVKVNELEMFESNLLEIVSKKKKVHDLRYRVEDIDGNRFWIRCQGIILWDKDMVKPLFFSGVIVSQENDFIIDSATKFPREAFALEKLSVYAERGQMIKIIGFSINHFSEINEIYGKEKGDALLLDISKNLDETFSRELSFYRLDGLRFAALISPSCEVDEGELITKIKQVILKQYKKHKIVDDLQCSFSYMNILPDEMSIQDMISNTIFLINIAKNSHDPDFVAHSIEDLNEQKQYAKILFELRKDIKNNFENFRLVIQPVFIAETNRIKGGEILLRWKYMGKDVSPAVFIPILEKAKLINSVGKWIFEETVKITKELLKINNKLQISSNVSYIQILSNDFISYVKDTVEEYNIDPSNLILELTETNFDNYPQKLTEFFNFCDKLGISVALDDFGSGYSSIGLLLKYPTDVVKLDKSLIDAIIDSKDNEKFIRSIVNACHIFGKQVCAEGVETKETLKIIKDAGCDIIQGFYFSRPLEITDYIEKLREERK